MDQSYLLRVLEEAQGDSALLALATVNLTFADLPESELDVLRGALQAASVPHWCDGSVLAELIDVPVTTSQHIWTQLYAMTVVEPFPGRGENAGNIHEASRLALRRRLATTEPDLFHQLSERAVAVFERDPSPAAQIEWIYHLLSADPDRGADALEDLGRRWSGTAHHEDVAALYAALVELDTAGALAGRALIRARVEILGHRFSLDGGASLGPDVKGLHQAAVDVGDDRLIADALYLLGDVSLASGDKAAAEAAFAENLTINTRLAASDPTNAGWRRDLGIAHCRVGDIALSNGDLPAAQAAFAQYLAISEGLAASDRSNATWQRELGIAYERVGDAAVASDDLAAADAAYAKDLEISESLADSDPTNAGWQRDLGVAYSRRGDMALANNDLPAAQAAFAQDLAISERLVARDPTNAVWLQQLGISHCRIGDLALSDGRLPTAQTAYAQYLAISERVAARDPSNAAWQRGLGVAYSRVGELALTTNDLHAAQVAYARALELNEQLVALDPNNAEWQRELAVARINLATASPPSTPHEEGLRGRAVAWVRRWKSARDAKNPADPGDG